MKLGFCIFLFLLVFILEFLGWRVGWVFFLEGVFIFEYWLFLGFYVYFVVFLISMCFVLVGKMFFGIVYIDVLFLIYKFFSRRYLGYLGFYCY